MEYLCKLPSPLGLLTVSSDSENITGLWLEGQKYYAATLDADFKEQNLPVFDQVREWLDIYFQGKNPSFMPCLMPKGSPFRQNVWKILQSIPYGEITTYGEIARQIEQQTGSFMSAQPVGQAVGHNPISILIPCHRVIGASGSLTGYAGGIERKKELLLLENNKFSSKISKN